MDLDALRSVLDDTPEDAGAFESLQDALISEGNLAELKDVYDSVFGVLEDSPERDKLLRIVDSRARAIDDEAVKHWLNAQLGLLFWRRFDNAQKAEVYFRRVQQAAGQGGIVAEFYTEYYAQRGNWRRLEQLFAEQGEEEITIKRKLAEIAESQGKKDKALAFWQAVFKADPSDTETYNRLRELLTELAKWHSLAELLKTRLKGLDADAVDEKVELLTEMIGIFEAHIQSDTKVIATWQSILDLQPDNAAAQQALEDLYTKMKRWPDLVKVLKKRIQSTTDDQTKVALHAQVAHLMQERFSNNSEAIKHFQAILALDPDHLEAIQQLMALYEQRKNWDTYIEVAQREIALTTDNDDDRMARLIDLAQLASANIRQPAVGMSLWEEIREVDPNNRDALSHLEQLYERGKSYVKLVDVLEVRYEHSEDDAERIEILDKMGQIYGARIKDEEKTAEIWRRVLTLDSTHRKAFNELRKRALGQRDWDGLEWLFRNYGTVSELVRTLEAQVRTVAPDKQIPMLARVAELALEAENSAKAVKALTSILDIDPANSGAAERLIPLYESLERWKSLPPVYDVVIAAANDAETRILLYAAKAAIHEDHLNDGGAAFNCFVAAYKEDHTQTDIRSELDRLAESSGSWEAYAGVLEDVVEHMSDAQEQVQTLLHVADVYYTQLGNDEAALTHYGRVLNDLDRGNSVALGATETIFRDTGRWLDLVDVLNTKLNQGGLGEAHEKVLRYEIGEVWRDRLDEPEAAMGVYREMIERFPDDTRIYDELANLHMQTQNWEQLRRTLDAKLHVLVDSSEASGAQLADLHCKLGMLIYSQQADVGLAVEHYQEALQNDANCDLAVTNLEELLSSDDHRQQIALALEPVYASRENYSSLVDILEVQLDAANKSKQKSILSQLVQLYRESLDDAEKTLWAASRLFAVDPNKAKVRTLIEELCESLNEWQYLADLYERHVADVKSDDVRIEIYDIIARTARDQLQDTARSERNYVALLDENPEHEATLDALELLYMDTAQPEPLLGILRRKADLCADSGEQIDLRFQSASILADRLGRVADAIEEIRQVLVIDPAHGIALARLDELYSRTESWDDLQDVLQSRADLAEDSSEKASLLVRLASLLESQLQNISQAINVYAQILEIDVQRAESVNALERLLEDESYAAVVAPLLELTYEDRDDWQGLVRIYGIIGEDSDEPELKVSLHYQIADLYEHRGASHDNAFSQYASAYQHLPDREDTLHHLLRLADTLQNHRQLTDLLRGSLDDVEDPERLRELHRVIASTLRDKCADIEGAVENFRMVLDLDDTDLSAIDALIDLYRVSDSFAELVGMLRRKAPLMTVDSMRKELLVEAGALTSSQLHDSELAITIYQDVLGIDSDDSDSLDALVSLYRGTSQWHELSSALMRKIELSTDLDDQKELARDLANVQATHLEDLDSAISTHRMVLGWDDSDPTEWHLLAALLHQTEQWLELLEVLDRQIELHEGDERVDFMLRKARVWDAEIGDTPEAIGVLSSILELNSAQSEAAAMLENIVRTSDHREMAFKVLDPMLSASEQWVRLYELLDTLAAHREDSYSRIDALHRMGRLAEEHLTDGSRAFACYGRALQEELQHAESMHAVERLASQHGLWEELTQLLSDGASGADDVLLKVQLRLRCGDILMSQISDYDRATAMFLEVREDEPDNAIALESLDMLYQQSGRWTELAVILQARLDVISDPNQKDVLFFRLADVAESQLEDIDLAFDCYKEVFYVDQANITALENLERMAHTTRHRAEIAGMLEGVYLEREAWDKLYGILELKLEVTSDPVDRLELLRRLAELDLEQLGRVDNGFHRLCAAFELDSEDDHLLQQMESLAAQTGDYATLKDTLLGVVGELEDDVRKVALWHKVAALLQNQLADIEQAEMIYKLVRQTDPTDLPALQALDRMYGDAQRWGELETILEDEIDNVEFEDDQVELLLRLGALQRDQLDRADDATSSYKRVLDINESHRVALKSLAELHQASGQYVDLFEVVRLQADQSESDDERTAHFRHLAQLAEVQLENVEDATNFWEEVLNLDHTDLGAIRNVQRLHRDGENHESLVEALERELHVVREMDSSRAVELLREMGRLHGTVLEDPLQSQEAWSQLLLIESADTEALEQLVAIHEEALNYESLSEVLETMVGCGRYADSELLDLHTKLARIYSDPMPKPDRAVWAWQRVREQSPEDMEAVENLERIFEDEARWDDAANILQIKASLVSTEDSVDVWLKLGELQQFQAGNWELAAAAYERVLDIVPSHGDAFERLDGLYVEYEQWNSLSELLEAQAQHVDAGEDRRELYVRLAGLYEGQLNNGDRAFASMQSAHSEVLGDTEVIESLERLGNAVEAWSQLVGEYDRAIESFEDVEDKIDYGLRKARVLRDKSLDAIGAIDAFKAILTLAPDHDEVLADLAMLLGATEQWVELVPVLESRLENCDDGIEQVNIALEIANVYRVELRDIEQAIAAYRNALDLGESEGKSIQALEDLFTSEARYSDLIDILETKIDMGLGDEMATKLLIGNILEVKLEDKKGAISAYEEVLNFDDTHREALDRLVELYGDVDDFDSLTEVYERLLHSAQNVDEQLHYCENLALLQQTVHENPEGAAEYFHRMLDIDPENVGAFTSLESLYTGIEQWEELIDTYRKRLSQMTDLAEDDVSGVQAWLEIKEKIASVYHGRLNDPDNAIYTYQEMLERVPGLAAGLDALEALYKETDQPEQVQEIIRQKAEHADTPAQRFELMCDRAVLVWSELSDADLAIEILQQVLEGDESFERALSQLKAIYQDQEAWESVIEVLGRQDIHAQTDGKRAEVQREIAHVYQTKLEDLDRAILHYEQALEAIPDDLEAAEKLARLYIGMESWVKAETLLSMVINQAPDDASESWRGDIHRCLGLALENLLRPQDALREYERAYELSDDVMEIAKALGRLAFSSGDMARAEVIYQGLIDELGDDASESDLVPLYKTLGEVALKQGNAEKAREYLEQTLALQPGNSEALKHMLEVCIQQDYMDGVIQYTAELMDLLEDDLEKFELQVRLGDMYLNERNDVAEAVAAYRLSLDYAPASKAAHLKIFQVLESAQRHDEAVEILQRLVELEENDPKRKATFCGAIGDIYREKLDDYEQAVHWYNEALDANPSLIPLFAHIDSMLTQLKDWETSEKSYRRMLNRIKEDTEPEQVKLQFKLLKNLGQIYRLRLNALVKAKAAFEAALNIKPNDLEILEILSELYIEDEEFDNAIGIERRLMSIEPGELRYYRRIKKMFDDLGDVDAAWVASGVLNLLGKAEEAETSFYNENAAGAMASDTLVVEGDIWANHLVSRNENILMGHIFQQIYQGMGDLLPHTNLKDLGLKKKNQLDLSQRELFTYVFSNVVNVLGLNPAPEVYVSSKVSGLRIESCMPPIIVIGNDLRQDKTEQELAFLLGKVLTYFHPLHSAVCMASPETLQYLLSGAMTLFDSNYDVGDLANDENFQEMVAAMSEMPVQNRTALGKWMAEVQSRQLSLNVQKWLNQIELTANHAGLVMCNDVLEAGKILKNDQFQTLFTAPSRLSNRDKLVDLAVYSLSSQYIDLRKALGLAIDG